LFVQHSQAVAQADATGFHTGDRLLAWSSKVEKRRTTSVFRQPDLELDQTRH
jgi:hypothetical protein